MNCSNLLPCTRCMYEHTQASREGEEVYPTPCTFSTSERRRVWLRGRRPPCIPQGERHTTRTTDGARSHIIARYYIAQYIPNTITHGATLPKSPVVDVCRYGGLQCQVCLRHFTQPERTEHQRYRRCTYVVYALKRYDDDCIACGSGLWDENRKRRSC